jgi:hypothetical protein
MSDRETVDVREYVTAEGRNPYREWLETHKRRGKTK